MRGWCSLSIVARLSCVELLTDVVEQFHAPQHVRMATVFEFGKLDDNYLV
jgi:hypothetical protein